MGSDLASVLWDVLDGYNFYKTFKTTAIGKDRRGLPQPVNRSLFFDEADSEGDDSIVSRPSDSSRQIEGNTQNYMCWSSFKWFVTSRGDEVKESVIVCINSVWFFLRKVITRKCLRNTVICWTLLVLLVFVIAGLFNFLEVTDRGGPKGSSVITGNEHETEIISEQNEQTKEFTDVHSVNTKHESKILCEEKCSSEFTRNIMGDPSNSNNNIQNIEQQIDELKRKLHENEQNHIKQLLSQSRTIENLKQQVIDLDKLLEGRNVQSLERSHTRNEQLEIYSKSISDITSKTQTAITDMKVDVEGKIVGLVRKMSSFESVETKMLDLRKELSAIESNFHEKLSDLNEVVEEKIGYSKKKEKCSSGLLTETVIRAIVNEEANNKAGQVNWITGVSSSSRTHKRSFFSMFSPATISRSPEITVRKRNCWPMHGSKGFIQYDLVSEIFVQTLAIEHLHKSRRLIIGSVPKDFLVEGSPDDGTTWLNLGRNTYDADGPAVQHFDIEHSSEPLKTIKLSILSNYGEEYTCIYRVAVHGKRAN